MPLHVFLLIPTIFLLREMRERLTFMVIVFDGECDGEDADAVGAYTQAFLGGPLTWITIPKEYWPASWHGKYTEPVVILRRNLYGHPLAGLYWQKHCQKALFSLGWEQVKGWECLYKHRADRLFLFVYVDDFKMAGLKCNMKGMWSKIASVLDIEPPLKLPESTYLGCRQSEFPYDDDVKRIIENRRLLVDWCLKRGHQSSQGANMRENLSSTPVLQDITDAPNKICRR